MIFDLLAAPITAPIGGFKFIMRTLLEMAEREMLDEDRWREELMLLQLRMDEGAITEEEYAEAEKDVIAHLRAAREYREAQAGAARGAGIGGEITWQSKPRDE